MEVRELKGNLHDPWVMVAAFDLWQYWNDLYSLKMDATKMVVQKESNRKANTEFVQNFISETYYFLY